MSYYHLEKYTYVCDRCGREAVNLCESKDFCNGASSGIPINWASRNEGRFITHFCFDCAKMLGEFNHKLKKVVPDELDGADLIAFERDRQMQKEGPGGEGWTPEHDDQHKFGEMAISAACYAVEGTDAEVVHYSNNRKEEREDAMPWGSCHDKRKKHPRLRQLIIAGALIAAEIDRHLREEKRRGKKVPGGDSTGEAT